MQSPQPRAGDLREFRGALISHELERRASEARHELLVKEIDLQAVAVSTAISSAGDTLRRQEEALSAVNREMANIAADRTRQVQHRTDRIRALEYEVQSQNDGILEGTNNVQWARDQLANVRRTLAESQLRVEELQETVSAHHSQVAETQRRVDAAKLSFDHLLLTQSKERNELERRAGDLTHALSHTQDEYRRLVGLQPVKEQAQKERLTVHYRRLESTRSDVEEKRTILSSIRQQIEDHDMQLEEANRRRRKHQDETMKELVSDRKAALQELQSERDRKERTMRAETEALLDKERARFETQHSMLPVARMEEEKGFARELDLHEQLSEATEATVGTDVLEQRITSTEDHANTLLHQIKRDEEAAALAKSSILERNRQIQSYRDAVAPLPDAEESCARLINQERQLLKDRTEQEAEHALWRAKEADRRTALVERTKEIRRETEHVRHEVQDVQQRTHSEIRDLEAQIKVQESELGALDSKLQDFNSRNRALDGTLEHVARQRRAMMEELAARREQARLAAAALVAQLE